MRKQILLLDKSSIHALKTEQISFLNSIYDIRYSPILYYELLIGLIKYGKEKIDQFIGSKIKSEYHLCYDDTTEMIKKEILNNTPITEMKYAKYGKTEDLNHEINNQKQYAQQQYDEEQKISEIIREHLNNNQSNYIIEFAELLSKVGNRDINRKRLLENLEKYLSKYKIDNPVVNNQLIKYFSDNMNNNRKEFKKETMRLMFLTEAFIKDIENLFNSRIENNINLIASLAKLTPKEKQEMHSKFNNNNIILSNNYTYTFFCYYIYMLYFNIEKCNFIIKTQVTNFTRDLRYLLHLPFCDIFASDDKDLIEICKNINYEYLNELKLIPEGFTQFKPELLSTDELLSQLHL